MTLPFSTIKDVSLQELIYEGPNTLVYKSWQSAENRTVLVKILKPQKTGSDAERIKRFQREGKAMARLDHPNIVDIYDTGVQENYHYLILEFVHGGNVRQLLESAGKVPLAIMQPLARQILLALQAAHQQQITHRDIKPANILIDHEGQVKLTDFGLARPADTTEVTQPGTILGTLAYLAPEQITGGAPDGRADIFAFGCVMYEMLSGTKAFEGGNVSATLHRILNETPDDIRTLLPELPKALATFIDRCLAKDPTDRWSSANEALLALEKGNLSEELATTSPAYQQFFQAHLPAAEHLSPAPESSLEADSKSPDRRKGIAIAAILLLFFSIFWFNGNNGENLPVKNVLTDSLAVTENISSVSSDNSQTLPDPDSVITTGPSTELQPQTTKEITAKRPVEEDQPDTPINSQIKSPDTLRTTIRENQTASLTIAHDAWASIFINGDSLVTTGEKTTVDLPPGQHLLRFSHTKFPPHMIELNLASGETRSVEWHFAAQIGHLLLEVHPWAEVYIDDTYRDTTPLSRPLAINSGTRVLELRHPQLQYYRENLSVNPGDTIRVKVSLKALEDTNQ